MKSILLYLFFTFMLLPGWSQQLPPVYAALEHHYNQNAFEACIKMEKQVQAFAQGRLDTLVANAYFYIGDAFNQVGEIKKALAYFELEKDALKGLSLAQTEDYSNSLNNLAYLYLHDGDYVRAGKAADEVIDNDRNLYRPTDDPFVLSVLYVADIYLQLDRIRDAETLLLNTLRPQKKSSVNEGVLLNKLGGLYSYTGQYTKASKALLDAIDIHAQASGETSAEFISTAINLGVLYMNQGKYPEAEEIFAVALSNIDPEEMVYPTVLNNQALVLQSLGQLERAEKTLLEIKSMDSLTLGPLHPDYAITLSNLGLVYADLKKFKTAEQSLLNALSILKHNNEEGTLSYARKLNNLAKIYGMAGAPVKAVPLLEEALSIFKKNLGKNSPDYATTAYNLGLAFWRSGKGDTGYKYLRTSATIRAKVLGKKHPKYAESILKIGEYQWHKKEGAKAQESFGAVFENFYYQIDETFPVLTEEEKSKFYYTNIRDAFDKFNSFAVAWRDENPSLVKDVYNYLVNTKAAIMFATEKVKESIISSGDAALIREFESWQAAKEQIAKLYSQNQEHKELDSLVNSANVLEKELTRKSSTFAGQFVRKKYSWEEIQKTLKPGEAAVEVLRFKHYDPANGGNFTDTIGYAFLVVTAETKASPALLLLEGGNDMENKFLKFYRNSIQYNVSDPHSYKHYFEPLANYLKKENITRLYFSPDGIYNQININTIENPLSGKFLIDEYDIRLVTNTRELAEAKERNGNNRSSILIGYPKFNLDNTELQQGHHKNLTRGSNVNRGWRGGLLRYMRGEDGISLLPGTQVEIQKISKLFGEDTGVYMAREASERMAKTVDNPPVLHIATHGYFLEDEVTASEGNNSQYISNPLLNAGLILAGAENFLTTGDPINDEGDDGILTAFEAMNMDLDNSDLVVLSACETGLGDVRNGEGVYGLQRAFKIAGARSIIMSLWNVDDEATQQLMTTFYEELFRSGDQHKAFRTAQQKVKLTYENPFYWGAFIMVGI